MDNVFIFDLRQDSMAYGKVLLSLAQSGSFTAKMNDPSGQEHTFSIDDGLSNYFVADIPKYATGSFMEGVYSFEVDFGNGIQSFSFEFKSPVKECSPVFMPLDIEMDCYSNTLLVRDNNSYEGVLSRKITISHPFISGIQTPPDVVSSDKVITVPVTHNNVIYQVVNEVIYEDEYPSPEGIKSSLLYSIVDSVNFLVDCDLTLKEIMPCIDKSIQNIYASACKKGGIDALDKCDKDLLDLIQLNLNMFNFWKNAKNPAKAIQYKRELIKLIPCDVKCEVSLLPVHDNIVYLKGDTGPQGEQGAHGLTGEQGPIGPQGENGKDAEFVIGDWVDLEQNGSVWSQVVPAGIYARITPLGVVITGNIYFAPGFQETSTSTHTTIATNLFSQDFIDALSNYRGVPMPIYSAGIPVGDFLYTRQGTGNNPSNYLAIRFSGAIPQGTITINSFLYA